MAEQGTIIDLRCDSAECAIAPALGGALLRLRVAGRDLLRPARDDVDDVLATASFPLVPFANRIADGRLDDGGRIIALPADPAAPPHAHHGHGWRAVWRVERQEESRATLVYEHPADEWPWAYRATQSFELSPQGLTMTLAVLNRDAASAMPVGAGIHPYFQRSPDSLVEAAADSWWANDDGGVARTREDNAKFAGGRAVEVRDLEGVDNFFVSPDPRLTIAGGGHRITLSGTGAGFHLYVPAGEPFFCVEPVTHVPDSFGRGEYTPADRLAPGEERQWWFAIDVER